MRSKNIKLDVLSWLFFCFVLFVCVEKSFSVRPKFCLGVMELSSVDSYNFRASGWVKTGIWGVSGKPWDRKRGWNASRTNFFLRQRRVPYIHSEKEYFEKKSEENWRFWDFLRFYLLKRLFSNILDLPTS